MIELKNVKKVYKSKKGTSTIALDDVNLKIGNTGMVFIVGKSGSGKSTLLNLLGGLDGLEQGEILINGKNISKFNKKQYDSYRNTYIGFIFQEFNILEQYNVYENIELALKLQNQKTSKDNIDELLNKLGLTNLGNRKINELSGGQKQRVAIGRALIKNPKIILADEPTGNLDKNASEQIFNILKEISKKQLVIVVSHDMESASKYADRIIKIEDGKVIEDTNIVDTIETNSFELKKSKLPFSYALKMALTSFKTKPLKLVMTILLTAISLIFMGFTVNCALFDSARLQAKVLDDNKRYFYDVYNTKVTEGMVNLELTDSNLSDIEKITNSKLNKVYDLYDNGVTLNFEYGEKEDNNKLFMYEPFASFVEIEDERIVLDIIGRLPKENNELVIHRYMADYIIKYGIVDSNNELYFPKSYEELVNSNRKLKLGTNEVVIVGMVNDDNSLYEEAFNNKKFSSDKLEFYYFENYVESARYIYVKGFTESVNLRINKEYVLEQMYLSYNNKTISNLKALNQPINIIGENGFEQINNLAKDEIVISVETLRKIIYNFEEKFQKYLSKHNNEVYSEIIKEFIIKYIQEENILNKINFKLYDYADENYRYIGKNVKIIGISLDEFDYISYNYVDEYDPITKKIYSVRIYDDNVNHLKSVFEQMPFREMASERGTYYTFSIEHDLDVMNVISVYKSLTKYILILSLIFVIFTLLLFSNFISVSISYCKKEIGILRALGATSNDVIKIFSYEAIIIGVIAWFVSIIGWYISCDLLNQSMFGNFYYTLNGIVTHPFVPIGMFIYTITIAVSITILSISKITNIKPIDAILNK